MAKRTTKKKSSQSTKSDGPLPIADTRHPNARRKNNPPAKIAAEGAVPVIAKAQYAYNPHLPPVLRFDADGKPDALPDLLAAARTRPLTDDEARTLAEALRTQEPWLEWTGKREKPGFAVDPVALHIHERISAQAILKVAARQDVTRSLFADPEQEYHKAVQFYQHEVDWSNRLILGDSLQVMSSLARREDLAGKVQMIYMDPPYGIKFASNFQPEVGKRDVKDKQEDLTREPEMVRAYRDTWNLGIHSYLSYLRDRLVVAKELLADTGSIFVQISDENVHRVRQILDDVLGPNNFIAQINYRSMTPLGQAGMAKVYDYLLWYARDSSSMKFRALYRGVGLADEPEYCFEPAPGGNAVRLGKDELSQVSDPRGIFKRSVLTSSGYTQSCTFEFEFQGMKHSPLSGKSWRTTPAGVTRLVSAERIFMMGTNPYFRQFLGDFGRQHLENSWLDTAAGFSERKRYVVQTNEKIVERCMLMTTDPGDLILDPTCGSGTTAYVAEQWGRRWITTDTSRVAVAIARQRLLTAKFDAYQTKGTIRDASSQEVPDPSTGFHYKTVPHITLKTIAQNVALDPIFAKHEPMLDAALKNANDALAAAVKMDPALATRLAAKLDKKQAAEGKRAITDADRRRWTLPPANRDPKVKWTVDPKFAGWYHWEVPFDADPDWPKPLQDAVAAYRTAWRAKMDAVNACIAASAVQEELVDQPQVIKGVTRVTGPFTVEAVQPPEMSLSDVVPMGFGGEPDELDAQFPVRMVEARNDLEVANVGAYLDQMFRFIRDDGVRFLNNRQMKWSRLEPLFENGHADMFHAEGRWSSTKEADPDPDGRANVAVTFGPQYGPVTGPVVVEALRQAHIRGYEHVVIAGFNFDGAAQTAYDNQSHPKVKIHLAHIRPDINPGMNGLLKESPKAGSGQLFTVFGKPRIAVRKSKDEPGSFEVEMEGVDIYDPVRDEIRPTAAGKVAAWFLDGDYDGRTFCVTQAFFPDRSAWTKLSKALNGSSGPIDSERFEAFSGTTSLPFPAGQHKCVAVKIIDPRGNEVMAVEVLR